MDKFSVDSDKTRCSVGGQDAGWEQRGHQPIRDTSRKMPQCRCFHTHETWPVNPATHTYIRDLVIAYTIRQYKHYINTTSIQHLRQNSDHWLQVCWLKCLCTKRLPNWERKDQLVRNHKQQNDTHGRFYHSRIQIPRSMAAAALPTWHPGAAVLIMMLRHVNKGVDFMN